MWKWPWGGLADPACVASGNDLKTGRFSHHAHLLLPIGATWWGQHGVGKEPEPVTQDEL